MYNLQGDVIGLADAATGKIIAKYLYDAWGQCISVENASGYTIGTDNPFRYRGYYYDTETGFYYLNSRYYDPEVGRFLNADAFVSTDISGMLSTNMFAYCENNPVNMVDPTGHGGIGLMSDWNPQEFHKNNKPKKDYRDILVDALIYSVEFSAGAGAGMQVEIKVFNVGGKAGFSGNFVEGYLENGKFGVRQSIRYGLSVDFVAYIVGFERSQYQDMYGNKLNSPEDLILIAENLHYTTILSASFYFMYGGSIEIGINWDKFAEYLSTHAERIE